MRQNHKQVFQAWMDRKYLSKGSCSHSNGTIYSYNTPILQEKAPEGATIGGTWELNSEKFSQTTTELQNSLRVLLQAEGIEWSERRF